MESLKRSGDFATGQVESLLSGLAEGNHGPRVKAIKRFQEYIAAYRPDIYDDDVDVLYKGKPEVGLKGLCAWAGMPSEKHSGQLKRTASNAVSLLKWLVTLDDDEPERESIFYTRFVCLPQAELAKIGFERHAFTGSDRSRTGNRDDAFELLSIILLDHRSPDNTELQPLTIEKFLPDPSAQMLFATWQQEFAATKLKQHIPVRPTDEQQAAAHGRGAALGKTKRNLPTTWSQETFEEDLNVMLLEENEGDIAHTVVKQTEADESDAAVPDPLDLVEGVDLRVTQAAHISSFRGMRRSRRAARSSFIDPLAVLMVKDPVSPTDPGSRRGSVVSQLSLPVSEAGGGAGGHGASQSPDMLSVLPSDKSFSPELFLTLVHSDTSFHLLMDGLKRLGEKLESQKEKRKHLVQEHYGLYVQCAEGIEWLKAEMQKQLNNLRKTAPQAIPAQKPGDTESFFEIRLHKANDLFLKAAEEARGTLRPLLDSMEKASKIRAAEQVLKRLAPLMELPLKMKEALKDGRYEEVLSILKRITSLTKNSSLNLIQQVAHKAAEIGQEFRTTLVAQLLEPQTDHVLLLNKLHLLQEWQALDELQSQSKRESKQNYPLQCFQHQLKHFLTQLDDIQKTNATEMTDAFLKAREMEIEMNDQAYETGSGRGSSSSTGRRESKHARTASGSNLARDSLAQLPSRRKTSSVDFSSGTRRSSLMRGSEAAGGNSGVDFSLAISLLDASDDETDRPVSMTNDDVDDEDDDVSLGIHSDDADEFAEDDSASVDTGSLTGASSGLKRSPLADTPLAPGVDRVTHECSIVRVRLVQRVVEHLARWLPCLHSLVLEIQRTNTPEAHARSAVDRRNRWIHDTQGGVEILPEKELSNAIQTASDITRKAILGSGSSSPSESQRQAQQHSMRRVGSAGSSRVKNLLNHPVHTQGLINPYLHHAVQEVSNLFEIVESLLGRSQDSPYFAAMSDLLLVTKEGEMAHAQRLVEALDQNLLTIANEKLFSHHAFVDDMPELEDGHAGPAALEEGGRSNRAPNTLTTRCKLLQQNVSQMLLMVHETCPHLEWSADVVKNGVRSCLLHFVQAFARHVAAWQQNVEARRAVGEYFSNHEDEDVIPLQILRCCYELRTNIIPTIYTAVARLFPSSYLPSDGHGDPTVEEDLAEDFVLVRDSGYMTDNSDAANSVNSRRSSRHSTPRERGLSKLFASAAAHGEANNTTSMHDLFEDVYRSVDTLQASAMQAFLAVQELHVRSILNSAWLKPAGTLRMQQKRAVGDSGALPTQLARILFLVVTVRARVLATLSSKSNEQGSTYESQILEGVCHSISSCYEGVLAYHRKAQQQSTSAQTPSSVRLLRDLRNELYVLSSVMAQQYPSCNHKFEQQIASIDRALPPQTAETTGSTQVDEMMAAAQIFLNALSGES